MKGPAMVVQKRRNSVSKVAQAALQFLSWRDQEAAAKKSKNQERDVIIKYLVPDEGAIDPKDIKAGNPNNVPIDEEKGHRYFYFDKPVYGGPGKTIKGLEYQRKVTGPYMDPDAVREYFDLFHDEALEAGIPEEEIYRRQDLWSKIYHPVTEHIIDFDVVYRLQQEGKLTKAEVEGLMKTGVTWSLNVKEL
jgi:hypothetical protein